MKIICVRYPWMMPILIREAFFPKKLRRYIHYESFGKHDVFNKGRENGIFNIRARHNSTQSTQIVPSTFMQQTTKGLDITHEEFSSRRLRLMDVLRERTLKHDHIVVMPGSPRRYMIDKIPYLFRQNTDMLYLSGCKEPDCVLVLHSSPGGSTAETKTVMFTPPYDPSTELWDGPRTSNMESCSTWGVDVGLPITELESYISSVESELDNPDIWYHHTGALSNVDINDTLRKWSSKSRQGNLRSPKEHIHSLRVVKSAAEIELMRHACRISSEAIVQTMRHCKAPAEEHELFASVDYHCRMRGADHLAYPPVVAGGNRANIIHYINNNQTIRSGEMVLLDAGGEYKGYSGDITRTWPVNGEFTSAQKDIYEAVLEIQNHVISQCADRPSLDQLFVSMCYKMGSALQNLSLIPKDLSGSQLFRAAYGFCPHHVSHYLGMDVHDTALVQRSNKISPGSVITVEPGVYISDKNSAVPSRYLGIGVRIEDDILITEDGVEVLSKDCPKCPDELERLIGSAL